MTERIEVACAADEGYVPHLAAMLHSLFMSTTGATLTVHFLHRIGLHSDAREAIASLCKRHGAVLHAQGVDSERMAPFTGDARYPEEAWYRVLLPSLLPGLERVLWLDADTLVLEDLRPLWQTDLHNRSVAAALNALAPHHRSHPQALGMPTDRWRYFNTGVMLLDLARMRANGAERRLEQAAARLRDSLRFAEQDVFNSVFGDDCHHVPLTWNVTAGSLIYARENVRVHGPREYRSALRAPRIVHFTLHKPWTYSSSHPYRDRYLHHRRAAGWPAPQYADKNLKNAIGRQLPLPLRALLSSPRRVGFGDLVVIARAWALK